MNEHRTFIAAILPGRFIVTSMLPPRCGRSAAGFLLLLLAVFTLTAVLAQRSAAASPAAEAGAAPRALLVGLRADRVVPGAVRSPAAWAAAPAVGHSQKLLHGTGSYHDPVLGVPVALDHIYRLELAPEAILEEVMAALQQRPDVAFVEPDTIAHQIATPNDPRFPEQWGLATIDAPAAWDVQTGGALVAVVDAGIDLDHPDLAGQLWINPGETAGNGIDDDSNGLIDDIHGWNFYAGNADLTDTTGHGTQVAGLIGATGNNGTGVTGVCWDCRLMVLKVIQSGGTANYSDVAAAIDYAATKGAGVINLSLGGYTDSATLRAAVATAATGSVLVAGAGNDGGDIPFYPAAYDGVLAVAGTDASDQRATTSNYGAWVDLSAPGTDVLTTYDGGSYGAAAGTSLAAPFASGAAALLRAEHGWSPALVRAHLQQTATPIDALNPGYEGLLGSGRLNAGAALTTAPGVDFAVESVAVDGRAGGQPEPGTTVDLGVRLANKWRPVSALQATLTSSDPYVTIVSSSTSYPALETGASAENSPPLRFAVATSAPYGHVLALRLVLRENGVTIANIPVNVTVANQTVNVSGLINSDTTWYGDRVYRVTGNLVVAEGATLTVEAGTHVEVMPGFVIRIQGELLGTGSADAPIVFTSTEADPAAGDWTGLETTNSGRIQLSYCDISYASTGINIVVPLESQTIDRCTIHHNERGIYAAAMGAQVLISESQIIYNVEGGVAGPGSSVTIQDSEIAYNGSGVAHVTQVVGNYIHHNGNTGDLSWISGVGVYVEGGQQIHNNTIVMNQRGILGHSADIQNNNIDLNALYNLELEGVETLVVADNWWGTTNLAAINASIRDFGEDSNLGIVDIQPILRAPSTAAPPYFYEVDVMPDTTVGLQEVTLDLHFSGPMDGSEIPDVALELEKLISAADVPGWTDSSVHNIVVAPDGTVWFATSGAVIHYDGSQGTLYEAIEPLNQYGISDMAVDGNGDLWAVGYGALGTGLWRFDGSTWTAYYGQANGGPLLELPILDIAAGPVAGVWLSQDPNHVTYFDGASATTYLMNELVDPGHWVNSLEVSPDGTLWASDGHSIYSYSGNQWKKYTPFAYDGEGGIRGMAAVDADEIWVISTLGVHHYDGTKWIRHDPGFYIERMSTEAVIFITPDREIVASGYRDWAYYDGSDWIQKGSLPGSLSAVSNDSIWFSTHSGALQLYDIIAQGGHWLDDNTFRATHQVTSLMPRGPYEVEVSGAIAATGRETPPVSRPAFTVDYAGEVSDVTPPPAPSLTAIGVDGDPSAVSARWSAIDPQSAIVAYRYAIGSSPGGREIVDWTTTTATQLERAGLGFIEGETYWFMVQAQNSGGLWSPITTRSFVAGQGSNDLYLPVITGR